MWRDAGRFWGRTPARSLSLMLGCALVMALLAVNAHLLRNSLWFVPPAVESDSHFVTLGAYSAEGRFDVASAADIRALDGLGFAGRYTVYGKDLSEVAYAGRTFRDLEVAFVSDEFFELLGVGMSAGAPPNARRSGLVLDYEFWRGELGGDRSIVGKSLVVSGASLPVVGVADARFRGLGDRHPAVWIPARMRAALLQLDVEGSGVDVEAMKKEIAEQLPVYHALVALKDPAERARLDAWRVQTAETVSVAGKDHLRIGVNRRDFRPAILDGINLLPAETAAMTRYLWLIAGLSIVLAVLAVLNLAAYWSARTAERTQEIHIRHAVGARLGDLLRLFAGETIPFLLAIILCALPLAALQLRVLHELEPFRTFLQHRSIQLSPRDFAPSLVVVVILGVIALLAPLPGLRRGSWRSALFGVTAEGRRRRLAVGAVQWVLVAAVAGLAGASMLAGYRMKHAGWGGDGNPLVVRLDMGERPQTLVDALQLDANSAATVQVLPLGGLKRKFDAYVPGLDGKGRRLALYLNEVSPAAVSYLGVPLRAGRVHAAQGEIEVMVSESYARALGVAPEALLNQPLVLISSSGREFRPIPIVGVLADVHYSDLRTAPEMVVYGAPDPGKLGSALLLPQSERGRVDAALSRGGLAPDAMKALSSVTSMQQLRDDNARTESLLAFGTFAYALLALALLMFGVVAEARMQLAQRGRELALVVTLGARLGQSVLRFLAAPLVTVSVAMLLVVSASGLLRDRWLGAFPMLSAGDFWSVSAMVLLTVVLFIASLVAFASLRLRRLSLAELLRAER
ncbi:MAG TPA: FtsX-like permease family protein [Thermoanaerobaculia bacterium]|nr:FtsX-like permease family protein [Thermoanaerobaculia bacterium]